MFAFKRLSSFLPGAFKRCERNHLSIHADGGSPSERRGQAVCGEVSTGQVELRDRPIDLSRVDHWAICGQPHHYACARSPGSLVITVQHIIEVAPEAGDACCFTVTGNRLIAGVSGGRHHNLVHQAGAAGACHYASQHWLAPHQAQHFAWQAGGAHARLDDCNSFRFAHIAPLGRRLDGVDLD